MSPGDVGPRGFKGSKGEGHHGRPGAPGPLGMKKENQNTNLADSHDCIFESGKCFRNQPQFSDI